MKKRAVDMDKERYWREVMHRFQASGLPFRKFCDMEGLSPHSFQAWRKKLRDRDEERGVESTITKGENRPNDWNEKMEQWKLTIERARTHPKGVMDFCRKNNIASQTLYEWTRRIKAFDPSWTAPPPVKGTETASQMFVPVSIVQAAEQPAGRAQPNEILPPTSQPAAAQKQFARVEVRMPSGCVVFIPADVPMWELAAFVKALGGKS